MKTPKELVRLIRESEIITNPGVDDRILQDARNELAKRRQDRTAPFGVLWRILMKSKKTTFAAVSMLVIAVLIVFQFAGNPVGPGLTFAQVIEPILKAKTATYDIVFGPDDGGKPAIHQMVMGSRIRRRAVGYGAVTIIDLENNRRLLLDEPTMEARYMVTTSVNVPKGIASGPNFLEDLKKSIMRLKDMPDYTVKELGSKQLDGREVVGFLASHPGIDMTIWADVNTGLPVRIKYKVGTMQVTCKNMKFDLPLEEKMFSMEVPPGYTVKDPLTLDLRPTEEKFIKGLRLIAEKLNYGCFPDDVSYDYFLKWLSSDPVLFSRLGAMSKEEVQASIWKLDEYIYFTVLFPGEGEWTYRGKGVRLGETETPIFWYKPQGSETYHVIYGDLHVENVDPEDLPE